MAAAKQTEKVRLVHVATGAVHEAWPVDVREHLAAGDFVREADYVPPVVDEVVSDTPAPKKGK